MHSKKFSLSIMIALVIGSIIGAAPFDLPQGVASIASPIAALIAWGITFLGMSSLVYTFQILSQYKPNLHAGIYSYAKDGFGDYTGFNAAWGYWVSSWLGNIAFCIFFCTALSKFFPCFGDGANFASLVLNSILIWGLSLLCVRGVYFSSQLNLILTVVKIATIIIFICCAIYKFDLQLFMFNATAESEKQIFGSLFEQEKNMMLLIVWVFIGIEGACVFSARARKASDVGKATVIGFIIVFVILVATSILPFGLLPANELIILHSPSVAEIMQYMVGSHGKNFINAVLVISVFSALLSWIMIAAEVALLAAKKDHLFPSIFARTNRNNAPEYSLYITALCQQIYLLIAYFYHLDYVVTVSIATSMILIPYLLSSLYLVKNSCFASKPDNDMVRGLEKKIISVFAMIYCMLLIYAAGMRYLLFSSMLYAIGIIFYIQAKKTANIPIHLMFKKNLEKLLLFLIVSSAFIFVVCF